MKHLLIVEDDAQNNQMIRDYLESKAISAFNTPALPSILVATLPWAFACPIAASCACRMRKEGWEEMWNTSLPFLRSAGRSCGRAFLLFTLMVVFWA